MLQRSTPRERIVRLTIPVGATTCTASSKPLLLHVAFWSWIILRRRNDLPVPATRESGPGAGGEEMCGEVTPSSGQAIGDRSTPATTAIAALTCCAREERRFALHRHIVHLLLLGRELARSRRRRRHLLRLRRAVVRLKILIVTTATAASAVATTDGSGTGTCVLIMDVKVLLAI